MTTVPNPKLWVDKERPDWKDFGQEIFDTLDFLMNPPMCWVVANAASSVTVTSSYTTINFGYVNVDMPGSQKMWKTTQPSRVTPKTAGRYKILYAASWYAASCGCTGSREARLRKNGSTVSRGRLEERPASSTVAHKVVEGVIDYMDFNGTTDYVELQQYTNGGDVPNGHVDVGWNSAIYVRWVSKL